MKLWRMRDIRRFINGILDGIYSAFQELNPIPMKLKKSCPIISALLSLTLEEGVNFYLKFLVIYMVLLLGFTIGYYVIGVIVAPLKFINKKLFATHSTIYIIYYLSLDEISYKFLKDTKILILVIMIISYLSLSLIRKRRGSLYDAIIAYIAVCTIGIGVYSGIILGDYKIYIPADEEIREIYSGYKIESNGYKVDLEEPLPPDNESYGVIWYGNENNKREIYGNARLRTEMVTIGSFIEEPKGLDNAWRTIYWDTDFKKTGMNGYIYYPLEGERHPVIAIIHGNHSMEVASETGYDYIGDYFARRGYIVAMLDENYFNGSWSGGYDDENDGRAYLTLKTIEQILKFNRSEGNPLYGKVDENNIGLIGHSRGGETTFLSKLFTEIDDQPEEYGVDFNFDFDIKSIATMGTTYGQYDSHGNYPKISDVNYLAIQGSNDGDVSEFQGKKAYDNVQFSGEEFYFKSFIYIEGANHGQFNNMWGSSDKDFPLSLLINKRELISGEKQREIAIKYLEAFFDTTLKGLEQKRGIFRDYINGLGSDESKRYFNGYADSTFENIENFEGNFKNRLTVSVVNEDGDSKWESKRIELRDGTKLNNQGLYFTVEGDRGEIKLNFKRRAVLNEVDYIAFDVSGFLEDELNYDMKFIVEGWNYKEEVEVDGTRPLWGNIKSNIMKKEWLNEKLGSHEDTVFQTIFIPVNSAKIGEIKGITFVFSEGTYVIDNISLIR